MESTNKTMSWIDEKAPWLVGLLRNKYVEMAHDRFASYPPKKQKQILTWTLMGSISFVFLFLLSSYWSLWSTTSSTQEIYSMSNLILQYQKYRRDRSEDLQVLSRNAALAGPGQLKQVLIQNAGSAGISPRMVQADERGDAGVGGGSDPKKKEVRIKECTVALQRVTLTQLTNYLKNIEYGAYNLVVSSIKIVNDDKLRGYLNVDLSVMAYLFEGDEG